MDNKAAIQRFEEIAQELVTMSGQVSDASIQKACRAIVGETIAQLVFLATVGVNTDD